MIKILITGSIGAGKSTVCKLFEELGISVYYSDLEAKKIMDTNPYVAIRIKKLFGDDIYKNGVLDRKYVADMVFKNKDMLSKLNEIVHPAVYFNFNEWYNLEKMSDSPYVIQESAIAIDMGIKDTFDYTIVVTADQGVRINRVIARDNCDREDVIARMNSQISDEEKLKHADFIIVNNDFPNIKCQVNSIHNKILEIIKK